MFGVPTNIQFLLRWENFVPAILFSWELVLILECSRKCHEHDRGRYCWQWVICMLKLLIPTFLIVAQCCSCLLWHIWCSWLVFPMPPRWVTHTQPGVFLKFPFNIAIISCHLRGPHKTRISGFEQWHTPGRVRLKLSYLSHTSLFRLWKAQYWNYLIISSKPCGDHWYLRGLI